VEIASFPVKKPLKTEVLAGIGGACGRSKWVSPLKFAGFGVETGCISVVK
jgi:hypothetical protein